MSTEANRDNGWDESAEAWLKLMSNGDPNRVFLLDDIMLGLCGEVSGLDVIDVGCGEGRFCRMLAERGARMVGIDPTEKFIAEARRRQPDAEFHVAEAENFPVADGRVDLAVSYLSLIDIPDYRRAISEIRRVLRPGGRCVVANLNGFITASAQFWAWDAEGRKLHWTMDDYMIERPNRAEWADISVINWHRPLSAYMRAFGESGFVLSHFDEPVPEEKVLRERPEMSDFLRAPLFCTMVWNVPAA